MSIVSEFPIPSPTEAIEHFSRALSFETDCADVAHSQAEGEADFVILHVVGSRDVYDQRHVPDAIYLPYQDLTDERLREWPMDTLFVVYGEGPHCNGADKAAWRLAGLGRKVKVMLGGLIGWQSEGLQFAGSLHIVP